MDWIDFRQLPPSTGGFSQLFFDYVYEFERVSAYYRYNFRNADSFSTVIDAIGRHPVDRATVTEVLKEQNTSFGAQPKTFENIALLAKPTTYAVVTGQQVGLFGGPL